MQAAGLSGICEWLGAESRARRRSEGERPWLVFAGWRLVRASPKEQRTARLTGSAAGGFSSGSRANLSVGLGRRRGFAAAGNRGPLTRHPRGDPLARPSAHFIGTSGPRDGLILKAVSVEPQTGQV